MIEARLPDGTALQFPEGTPDSAVDAAVKSHIANQPSMVGSALRGAVKGITFGFGDELRAGTDALAQGAGNLIHGSDGRPSMGQAYDRSLAASRETDRLDAETNPVSNVAGQLVGGIGTGLAAGPLGVAKAAASVARPVVGGINALMRSAPSWIAAPARVAGVPAQIVAGGAAAGGVQGFGEGEGGVGSRLEGAGVGAGVGALVAPVVRGLTYAAPAVAGRVTHALGWRNADTAADRQVIRALDRSGTTLDDVDTQFTAAGSNPTTLVDVGGANIKNLGAVAANTPGASMQRADDFVQGRRGTRPDRLFNAGDAAFSGGSSDEIADALSTRATQRTAEATPLYKEAFGQPVGMTSRLEAILEDPDATKWMKAGLEQQKRENRIRVARGEEPVPIEDAAIHFDEHGDPRIVGTPNLRTLDAVKRGIDAVIEKAPKDAAGRPVIDSDLRLLEGMRKALVELLDEGSDTYSQARAAWAGPSSQMEAIREGEKALRTDPNAVGRRMADTREGVPEGYRLGAGRDYHKRVADPAKATGNAREMLENREMQERLRHLLGDDGLDTLNQSLRREVDYTDVERKVSPRAGSQTHRLGAGGEDMGIDPSGPGMQAVRLALSGHPIQAAIQGGQNMMWRRLGQGMTPATADALANKLFVTDPVMRQRVADALRTRLLQDEARRQSVARFVLPTVRSLSQTAADRVSSD